MCSRGTSAPSRRACPLRMASTSSMASRPTSPGIRRPMSTRSSSPTQATRPAMCCWRRDRKSSRLRWAARASHAGPRSRKTPNPLGCFQRMLRSERLIRAGFNRRFDPMAIAQSAELLINRAAEPENCDRGDRRRSRCRLAWAWSAESSWRSSSARTGALTRPWRCIVHHLLLCRADYRNIAGAPIRHIGVLPIQAEGDPNGPDPHRDRGRHGVGGCINHRNSAAAAIRDIDLCPIRGIRE